MKNNPLNLIMFFIIISFVPLISIIRTESFFFITEVLVILILLVFSVLTFFMIFKKMNIAWSFSLILFSLHLMNVLYLFLIERNSNLILYSLIVLLGFIVSVYHVDQKFRKKISSKIKVLKKPKKVNVKKSSSKKVNKKNKKSSKKTTKKKIAKKKKNK